MLPGAVTPLSLSTSVHGIDMGLRRMLVKAGAYRRTRDVPCCIPHFSNHLFFNLTAIYKMGYTILGADKSHVESSICGKVLDVPDPPFRNSNVLIKAFNSIRYFRFLFSRKRAMRTLDRLADSFSIPEANDPQTYFRNIDTRRDEFVNSAWYHYITSSHSGAMSSTLLMMIREKHNMPDSEARSLVAGLLEEIDGIESVDILRSMRRIAAAVVAARTDAGTMSVPELEQYVLSSEGAIREAYDAFIRRHGHRGIREAEMRSAAWRDDAASLFGNILTVIRSGAVQEKQQPSRLEKYKAELFAGQKGTARRGLEFILNQARAGVYGREYTKARYIKVLDVFKQAYMKLGAMLVDGGVLPDADLVYFLTQDELGELVLDKRLGLVKTAMKRRRLLPVQQKVRYNDVYIGDPEPIEDKREAAASGTVLKGIPISRGEVTGRARVVRSVEDAAQLEPGEIMIACFTDIGWSPYYSLLGGLVTEVGSALSHGAVVAREYGLPLVVNVRNATNVIKTGDLIRLDSTVGDVEIIESV